MIDAGVNLTDKRLDYDSVVEDCNKANITHIVAIGTTLEESIASVNYAKQSPKIWATAGIHPHYAESTTTDQWKQLTELVYASEVVAVGDCGLDFNRNFSTPESQRYWFENSYNSPVKLENLCISMNETHLMTNISYYPSMWPGYQVALFIVLLVT